VYSPNSPGPNDHITSPRTAVGDEHTNDVASPRCPTPVSLEPEIITSDGELELKSIDELTDDSSGEGTGFWVRERIYRPPSSRIPPTPYFDLILKSFDDCNL